MDLPRGGARGAQRAAFQTGDLAYRDADGFLYFAGRDFEWLRVDGENFAAAPIERILARHRGAVPAAVYAVPDVDVGDQVMAAIEMEDPESFDPAAFDAFLAEQPDLGTKWAPRYVRVTRSLPVTQTCKVEKRKLRSERWECDEPAWFRSGRSAPFRRLGPGDRAALRAPSRSAGARRCSSELRNAKRHPPDRERTGRPRYPAVRCRHPSGMLDLTAFAVALTAPLAAGLGLRHLERRLPLWLARRESGQAVPPPAAVLRRRGAVAAWLLAPKLALWLAVLFLVSDQLPGLMHARDELAVLVSGSFMAPLVQAGMRSWSALELIELPLLLVALWIGVGLVTRGVRARLAHAGGGDWSGVDTFTAIARYALLAAGSLVILQARGVDLGSLALFGGVLGVGIGFGVQNIARNFVSGLLLAVERPIKPGDYVSLGAFSGTVRRIGARATEVLTPDHVSILVPNARFLEEEVVNWSHGNPICKLHLPVGVAYGSDLARVRAALLEAAHGHPKVLADPRPTVDLDGFGDSALLFDLEVWTRDPQEQNELKSSLNIRIEASLRRYGIEVPFPQRVLHVRGAEPAPAPAAPLPEPAESEIDPSPSFWPEARIAALASRMREPGGVAIADRRHHFRVHRRCCVGSEIVGWLVAGEKLTRDEALAVGRRMMEQGLLRHVLDEHGFEDAYLFYRFAQDEAA